MNDAIFLIGGLVVAFAFGIWLLGKINKGQETQREGIDYEFREEDKSIDESLLSPPVHTILKRLKEGKIEVHLWCDERYMMTHKEFMAYDYDVQEEYHLTYYHSMMTDYSGEVIIHYDSTIYSMPSHSFFTKDEVRAICIVAESVYDDQKAERKKKAEEEKIIKDKEDRENLIKRYEGVI